MEAQSYPNLLEPIAKIVGPNNVSDQDHVRYSYAKDWTPIPFAEKCVPNFVVQPTSAEEVAEIVRLANREKVPIVPWGGNGHFRRCRRKQGWHTPRHAQDE